MFLKRKDTFHPILRFMEHVFLIYWTSQKYDLHYIFTASDLFTNSRVSHVFLVFFVEYYRLIVFFQILMYDIVHSFLDSHWVQYTIPEATIWQSEGGAGGWDFAIWREDGGQTCVGLTKGWRRNEKIHLNFGDNFLECCTVVSFILDEFDVG